MSFLNPLISFLFSIDVNLKIIAIMTLNNITQIINESKYEILK